ncbi:hypothetical protein DC498_12045 [Terrimonas sp.]|nr:hypothetical protein DC498_12045 [Terrimonas sp.]
MAEQDLLHKEPRRIHKVTQRGALQIFANWAIIRRCLMPRHDSNGGLLSIALQPVTSRYKRSAVAVVPVCENVKCAHTERFIILCGTLCMLCVPLWNNHIPAKNY